MPRLFLWPLSCIAVLTLFLNALPAVAISDAERAEIRALMKNTNELIQQNNETLNNGYDRINNQADKVNSSFDTLNQKVKESNARSRQRVTSPTVRQPENYGNWRKPLY